ncbi:hypothetical protein N0V93_001270 [Gnomoniopsis smithogilvyi]|uniref:Uncharacterized protein n=1 Tax=Gnomoniopsis smithogilvyi TaxID=1191159 RepID=A0A9W8Z1B1_9PEZI|nr:hypothetical protein N0V93_001270 [Gnomoniopsis smithogilvyi]
MTALETIRLMFPITKTEEPDHPSHPRSASMKTSRPQTTPPRSPGRSLRSRRQMNCERKSLGSGFSKRGKTQKAAQATHEANVWSKSQYPAYTSTSRGAHPPNWNHFA